MRIASEGVSVGCLIPRDAHRALKARADEQGLSVAQVIAAMIHRSLGGIDAAGMDPDPGRHQADTDRSVLRQLEIERNAARLDITGLKIALTRAQAEAARSAVDRAALEDQIEQLRSRLFEMEAAVAAPVKKSKNHKLTEMLDGDAPRHRDMVERGQNEAPATVDEPLTPAFVKSCVGFRSVGNSPSAIAKLMRCDVSAVKRALDGRR